MDNDFLRRELHAHNRASWNEATKAHNSHKGNQARFFREGGNTLRAEETELLGDVKGCTLVHLLCNSGQDTLSIAAHLGAIVTGVDISDEAIAFAQQLSLDSQIPATFVRSDVFDWLDQAHQHQMQFDLVFSSYGVMHWISNLSRWAQGIAALLKPGGRFVLVDFHPLERIFDHHLHLVDSYFPDERVSHLEDGVSDYITRSPGKVTPFLYETGVENFRNPHQAHLFLWTLGEILTAIGQAGLCLKRLQEYPHSIAMRFGPMREIPGYRTMPLEGMPLVPLLFGLQAEKR
ncbi:MAG TPA: class I SAM-dependent methyltransferase [Ktedonobacteraceae bacterium]|nr:class I SAM-dependent methyltransferase [Ktedonobacteraceae bacterium]